MYGAPAWDNLVAAVRDPLHALSPCHLVPIVGHPDHGLEAVSSVGSRCTRPFRGACCRKTHGLHACTARTANGDQMVGERCDRRQRGPECEGGVGQPATGADKVAVIVAQRAEFSNTRVYFGVFGTDITGWRIPSTTMSPYTSNYHCIHIEHEHSKHTHKSTTRTKRHSLQTQDCAPMSRSRSSRQTANMAVRKRGRHGFSRK